MAKTRSAAAVAFQLRWQEMGLNLKVWTFSRSVSSFSAITFLSLAYPGFLSGFEFRVAAPEVQLDRKRITSVVSLASGAQTQIVVRHVRIHGHFAKRKKKESNP